MATIENNPENLHRFHGGARGRVPPTYIHVECIGPFQQDQIVTAFIIINRFPKKQTTILDPRNVPSNHAITGIGIVRFETMSHKCFEIGVVN